MKTRSTTRAEASSRLQVSTRSRARAAMAPPAIKSDKKNQANVGYKRPRQKASKLNAPPEIHTHAPAFNAPQSSANATKYMTVTQSGNAAQVVRSAFEETNQMTLHHQLRPPS